MQNIHLAEYAVDGHLSIHYGQCDLKKSNEAHHAIGSTHVGQHRLAKRHLDWENHRPTRFVWLPPKNISSGGCLHAFSDEELIGTSEPVKVKRRKLRKRKTFADVADPEGPWFDGVKYLQQKEPDSTFVAQAKSKSIGIIGGGMSGLMTAVRPETVLFYNTADLHHSIFLIP